MMSACSAEPLHCSPPLELRHHQFNSTGKTMGRTMVCTLWLAGSWFATHFCSSEQSTMLLDDHLRSFLHIVMCSSVIVVMQPITSMVCGLVNVCVKFSTRRCASGLGSEKRST